MIMKNTRNQQPTQYELWTAWLPYGKSKAIKCGVRPVIVVSNHEVAHDESMVTVVPVTADLGIRHLPTQVYLSGYGLDRDSLALCDQIHTLDRRFLIKRIGELGDFESFLGIRRALRLYLGLGIGMKGVRR